MATTFADVSKFLAACKTNREKVLRAGMRAMELSANHVIGDAQELCPIDTGFLKSSAFAEPPKMTGDRITARIGFNASYALAVHERLDVYHPQGQAKFLETAIRNNVDNIAAFMLKEMKAASLEGAK